MRALRHIIAVFATVLVLPSHATAATFFGEFWDAGARVQNLAAANAVIAGNPATATFTSSGIDYPQGNTTNTSSTNTTLAQYLGTDAPSIVGPSGMNLRRSVFRFTGYLDLLAGPQTFGVGSDDGFQLTIGNVVVAAYTRSRGFRFTNVTTDAGTGRTPFELIYFENQGRTGVEFLIDDVVAAPSTVPLPGALGLLLAGLGALGFSKRRRASA